VPIRRKKYYQNIEFLERVGLQIRKIRKQKGITLEQLAFACNDIDYAYINKIELGKVNFSISYLFLIAEKLDVSITELLNFND
jgi:transcriptional regulator with XRE-family HTH domain